MLAENNHEYLKAALMDQLGLAVLYGHVNFTILNSFGETILSYMLLYCFIEQLCQLINLQSDLL